MALLTPQVMHADLLYKEVLKNSSGLWIGKSDKDNLQQLQTKDKKINLHIKELSDWIDEITPEQEEKDLQLDAKYPFILNAGRHKPENANTLMRNQAWNKGRKTCTLAMNPADAKELAVEDGETVRIITEAAEEQIELEITSEVRKGQVLIPHGFGLKYRGQTHGINVNRLTKSNHRDRLAATPLHRYVACRVEKIIA